MRVPFADSGPAKVPDGLTDEQVLFLSDIFPTGYMGADFCNIRRGDTIAVWGCGPVGQMAIRSAFMFGAGRVIAIDTVPERLALAQKSGAETLDFKKADIYGAIQERTLLSMQQARTAAGHPFLAREEADLCGEKS